jgi:hypothetical protein
MAIITKRLLFSKTGCKPLDKTIVEPEFIKNNKKNNYLGVNIEGRLF